MIGLGVAIFEIAVRRFVTGSAPAFSLQLYDLSDMRNLLNL